MSGSRRDFIKAGLIGAAAAGLPATSTADTSDCGRESRKQLDILVLGGTGFIGPHMVREALRRGHSVALFNRGRTNNELFPDLETITGDRDKGLDGLKGRRWDAVIDNSGYVPRHVQDSARLLAPNCDRYLFISTVAVYADIASADGEDSALATIADESIEEVNRETYGPLKALCEKRAAAEIPGDRLTVLRPTYIAGPGDRTDRFSYWPIRTRQGGEMLWPGSPTDPIQIVDVRDLANFTIDCLDRNIPGTYNMVNPPRAYTMSRLAEDCQAVTSTEVEAVWVAEDFLVANGLNPGAQIPIWGGSARSFGLSTERALAAGMRHRPERETARDLLAWWDTLPQERRSSPKAGPGGEKEAEVIAAWKAAQA
jgi:2'-hydroxyisoflavone reductase